MLEKVCSFYDALMEKVRLQASAKYASFEEEGVGEDTDNFS